jgi:hypothetical protein
VSALVRLVVGLIVLWIALAAAFSLIFLDVQPKSKRFFVRAIFLALFPCLTDYLTCSSSFLSHLRFYSLSHTSMSSIQPSCFSDSQSQHRFARLPSASRTSRNC